MKDIKFRAWDEFNKTMWNPKDYPLSYHTDLFNSAELLQRYDTVMQYTGLKDKNNNEVYEGDIVICTAGCPHEVKWFEDNGGMFFGGMPGFNLDGLSRNGGKGYAWTGKEEVVGNIYEHPHLLSKEQNAQASVATEDQSSNKAD